MIRRLFQAIKGFLRGWASSEQPRFLCPGPAPLWRPEHRQTMAQFLSSETGRIFIQRARAVYYDLLQRASADSFYTQHSVGQAKGFGDCLLWIESLSRSSRDTDETSAPDESGVNEDTQAPGEVRLRELLSP